MGANFTTKPNQVLAHCKQKVAAGQTRNGTNRKDLYGDVRQLRVDEEQHVGSISSQVDDDVSEELKLLVRKSKNIISIPRKKIGDVPANIAMNGIILCV